MKGIIWFIEVIILWLKITIIWVTIKLHAEGTLPSSRGWRRRLTKYPENYRLPSSTEKLIATLARQLLLIHCHLLMLHWTILQSRRFVDRSNLIIQANSWLAKWIALKTVLTAMINSWGLLYEGCDSGLINLKVMRWEPWLNKTGLWRSK